MRALNLISAFYLLAAAVAVVASSFVRLNCSLYICRIGLFAVIWI